MNMLSTGGCKRYSSRSFNTTVSEVGVKRDLSRRTGALAATVGGSGTATGTGGLAGGSAASPGGTGNFQPSVQTVNLNLSSKRTQGRSVRSRAVRTPAIRGVENRASVTMPGASIDRFTASSGTLHDPHLASFRQGIPDARERLKEIEPAQPVEQVAQPHGIVGIVRMNHELLRWMGDDLRRVARQVIGRCEPDDRNLDAGPKGDCVECIGQQDLCGGRRLFHHRPSNNLAAQVVGERAGIENLLNAVGLHGGAQAELKRP